MVETVYLLKCHTYPALLGTPSEPSVKRERNKKGFPEEAEVLSCYSRSV